MKLLTGLFCAAILLGPLEVWNVTGAWAQSRHEQRIEGVSFSEIAQWQSRYGGGPFYAGPGMPGPGVGCVQPYPVIVEPMPYQVKKSRKGKKSGK